VGLAVGSGFGPSQADGLLAVVHLSQLGVDVKLIHYLPPDLADSSLPNRTPGATR
jgi:hypothetical protein